MTNSPQDIIILFNYGGGMRGLIPAHIMAAIEDKTRLPMAHMIDVFCGPSTGAILNAALNVPDPHNPARPRFSAQMMVKFYEREGGRIFPSDRFRDFRGILHDMNNRTIKSNQIRSMFRHSHYNPAHLQKCLRDLFGERKLSESLKNLVIPVYNIDAGDHPDTGRGGYSVWLKKMQIGAPLPTPDVSLYDAVLASCAAPTYFPCHGFQVNYADDRGTVNYSGIDGSIFDNPPISYYGAIRPHIPEGAKVHMIMLGTGHTLRSFAKDDWNKLGGLGVVDPTHDLPLITTLFHAPETALVDSFHQEMKKNAYIFNKSIIYADSADRPSKQIDDASPRNMKALKHFALAMIEENQKQFDAVCDLLVRNYERKKSPVIPEKKWFSFFTGK